MSKILETSAVRTKIGNVGRSEASRRQNIQEVCIAICGHALKYGSSPLGTLLLAKLNPVDKKAVGAWLNQHGPFVIEGGTDVVFSKKIRKERFGNMNSEEQYEEYVDTLESDETPLWYEARKAKAASDKTKDADELFTKLVKSLKKAHASDETPVENVGLLSYIEGAIARYHSDMALAAAQAKAATPTDPVKLAELRERDEAQKELHTVPEADEVTA